MIATTTTPVNPPDILDRMREQIFAFAHRSRAVYIAKRQGERERLPGLICSERTAAAALLTEISTYANGAN